MQRPIFESTRKPMLSQPTASHWCASQQSRCPWRSAIFFSEDPMRNASSVPGQQDRVQSCFLLEAPSHEPPSTASALLDLLQLTDSGFPSGSYAHSGGLEWLFSHNEPDLEQLLTFRLLGGVAQLELPLVRAAFLAPNMERLIELDRLCDALLPAREPREASR